MLRGQPGKECYADDFNGDGSANLTPVPRFECYRDFWFVCFDRTVPSLVNYLGNATGYLDVVADLAETGMPVVQGGDQAQPAPAVRARQNVKARRRPRARADSCASGLSCAWRI